MSDHARNPNQLPTKRCAACGREFTWRKKWARDWEQVRYCSDRCRAQGNAPTNVPDPPSTLVPTQHTLKKRIA